MPRMGDYKVRSPGHEGAGVVVKVGENVKNWKVGDRGGVKPMWDICLNCEWCWDGQHETYCAKAVSTGLMKTGKWALGSLGHMTDVDRHLPALYYKSSKVYDKDSR
jgi:propanol-preferring alcohol dehydrogenase